MTTHKVMVVDDSAVIRALLKRILESEPSLEVVYAAPNAELGLGYLDKNEVDIVLLDIEMPKIDGLEALRRIRAQWETLPVLMCSSLTLRGAEVTLKALSEGASDYIPKPTADYPKDEFERDLRTKVLGLLEVGPTASMDAPTRPAIEPPVVRRTATGPIEALTIGCSTGGPNALGVMFKELYRPLPVPLFIVQHMPPLFTSLLAERLSASSGQVVKEGVEGEIVEPGVCYLAPGGKHMVVQRQGVHVRIALNEDPPENFCRPAVDVLFRSLAKVYGGNVLGTVLTGMGHDGALGAKDLVEVGARIVVQDPGTCVVPSMPNGVINAGAAHGTMTLAELGREFDQAAATAVPARAAGG